MDFSLFGFKFGGKKDETEKVIPSIVAPDTDDGTTIASQAASYYGYYVDMDGTVKDEIQSIQKYREISLFPDVDIAVQDIVNEAIPYEDDSPLVEIVVDKLETSDAIKDVITEEFNECLSLLKFNEKASDIFRKWYVDGRIYYNVLVSQNPKDGIAELRPIEATKIKKIAEIIKDKTPEGVEIVKGIKEYYVYSQAGFIAQTNLAYPQQSTTAQGVRMSPDAVIYIPSGFTDQNTGAVMSYLQKALRPANQLRMLEDAVVIYRLSRAPERRIFYVDVGNLPKAKAEQYVKDIMNRYRNKLVYDAKTGEIRDDKKYMSMLEDFWMPRRDGSKGTEITTLQGGQNLGELTDIEYFQHKLYSALNIPISRVLPDQSFNLGRSTEVTRDEVKFQKFINKIRRKFSELFFELLRTQLTLKGIINEDDWQEIKENITFRFQKDNFFSELKNQEMISARMQVAQQADFFLGKYFSVEYIAKNIFQFNDEEIQEMAGQMETEYQNHPYWFSARAMYDQQEQMADQQQDMGMMQQQMGMAQQDMSAGMPQPGQDQDPSMQQSQPMQQ
jgi:hypothetical protein